MTEWISVKDKLPEDFEEVLYIAMTDHGRKDIMTGHRVGEIWFHCCLFYSSRQFNDLVTITHWMPLPEVPE